jgi:hypothetical protein
MTRDCSSAELSRKHAVRQGSSGVLDVTRGVPEYYLAVAGEQPLRMADPQEAHARCKGNQVGVRRCQHGHPAAGEHRVASEDRRSAALFEAKTHVAGRLQDLKVQLSDREIPSAQPGRDGSLRAHEPARVDTGLLGRVQSCVERVPLLKHVCHLRRCPYLRPKLPTQPIGAGAVVGVGMTEEDPARRRDGGALDLAQDAWHIEAASSVDQHAVSTVADQVDVAIQFRTQAHAETATAGKKEGLAQLHDVTEGRREPGRQAL